MSVEFNPNQPILPTTPEAAAHLNQSIEYVMGRPYAFISHLMPNGLCGQIGHKAIREHWERYSPKERVEICTVFMMLRMGVYAAVSNVRGYKARHAGEMELNKDGLVWVLNDYERGMHL